MSEEMDVTAHNLGEVPKSSDCPMEEVQEDTNIKEEKSSNKTMKENNSNPSVALDTSDPTPNAPASEKEPLKVQIPDADVKTPSKDVHIQNQDGHKANILEEKLSPPLISNSLPFRRLVTPPATLFQKPSVTRTHSLGAGDQSPFSIRKRSTKAGNSNPMMSSSAFKRRKLYTQSPIPSDVFDSEENRLIRCNSAPMLNDINDMETQPTWPPTSVRPGQIRVRRFSATVVSANASPSAGSSKSTSRLHQLKKEESLEGIQHKETAHEREVQTSIQMFNTCEELSLTDSTESLNGSLSGAGDGQLAKTSLVTNSLGDHPHSPLTSTASLTIPSSNRQCPTRAIDFTLPGNGGALHHVGGGGIRSPLTISPSSCFLSSSPLPPSPTRGLWSTGKQCFSPSMQAPVCLRPGSPSPSPTRRGFGPRRRSQSPCIVKPSVLSIKRKYDSDSEGGGSSPKRMFVPGCGNTGTIGNNHGDSLASSVVVPIFSNIARTIQRSHSLSSSSIDSDINVSPSPPQVGVNQGFPLNNTLMGNPHIREGSNSSMFQSSIHNSFLGPHTEVGRCSSPASSTCSSSSLEGLKDLQPFAQNQLNLQHQAPGGHSLLIKPPIKDQQSSIISAAKSTTNVTL